MIIICLWKSICLFKEVGGIKSLTVNSFCVSSLKHYSPTHVCSLFGISSAQWIRVQLFSYIKC